MDGDKAFSFLKGLFLGAIAGAAAGILLAPKSGKETQEDLKKLAKEYTEKAVDMYEATKKILEKKLDALKKAGSKIDESKYMGLVTEVVEEIKKDGSVTAEAAKKLGNQLRGDWDIVKTEWSK
ncbi:YtxH domain-containing protein [Patescibacteria group bacterium]|nr:YtxH domain-containing protein [Patescibacteria group bacterium]